MNDKKVMAENINHPQHYNDHPSGVECIDIVEHMPFNIGNAIKYLWRAGIKATPTLEDLEKARWYVEREIRRLKRPSSEITPEIRQLVRDTLYTLEPPPVRPSFSVAFDAFAAHAGNCAVCAAPGLPCEVGRPLWGKYVSEFEQCAAKRGGTVLP
jgi:hypothetical protein